MRSFAVWSLLALLLTSWTARAEDPDSDYTSVYITIAAADDLYKHNDFARARVKYLQAQTELQAFQRANPTWNNQIVTFRLNYLTERIAATQKSDTAAKAKAEAAATAAKAGAAAVPKLEISLVDAGAEPRKVLRFHPHVGDKQTVVATMTKSMGVEAEGQEMQTMQSPGIKTTTTVTVKDVSSGDITYEARLDDLDLVAEEGELGPDADKMKASLAAAKGILNIVTVSDRGTQKSSRMEAPAGSDPKLAQAVNQMKDLFPDIVVNLPEEAVGVGAKWKIAVKSKMEGMAVDETSTVEIVSIEGDVVTVKLSLVQSAPPQTISTPAMAGLKLNLTHLSGKGDGNVTFDLGQPLPSKGSAGTVTEYTVDMNKAGQKKTMTMKSDNSVTFEAK